MPLQEASHRLCADHQPPNRIYRMNPVILLGLLLPADNRLLADHLPRNKAPRATPSRHLALLRVIVTMALAIQLSHPPGNRPASTIHTASKMACQRLPLVLPWGQVNRFYADHLHLRLIKQGDNVQHSHLNSRWVTNLKWDNYLRWVNDLIRLNSTVDSHLV
jgi:hypothetical protein